MYSSGTEQDQGPGQAGPLAEAPFVNLKEFKV